VPVQTSGLPRASTQVPGTVTITDPPEPPLLPPPPPDVAPPPVEPPPIPPVVVPVEPELGKELLMLPVVPVADDPLPKNVPLLEVFTGVLVPVGSVVAVEFELLAAVVCPGCGLLTLSALSPDPDGGLLTCRDPAMNSSPTQTSSSTLAKPIIRYFVRANICSNHAKFVP
jgi:hypothetical protein